MKDDDGLDKGGSGEERNSEVQDMFHKVTGFSDKFWIFRKI